MLPLRVNDQEAALIDVVSKLREIDEFRLCGVSHFLQLRRHIGVGAIKTIFNVMIALGKAAFFFDDQGGGTEGMPVGVPVQAHFFMGEVLTIDAPEHFVLRENLTVNRQVAIDDECAG